MNTSIKSLILFFLFGCISQPIFSQLYINEWMASNSSVITDPDFDNSGDWVELFNDFNDPLDISGYFLSDNLNEPTRWMFPAGTIIDANSHLLIWADGMNTGLHTSFKLTKDGEEIGLYDSDTIRLDQIKFEHQKTNISMGRSSDGSSSLGFFIEPTPGTSNSTNAFSAITFYQTDFSVRGGIHQSPFVLELSTIEGDIHFTTDGSFPSLDSEKYTAPISIDKTTVVRATVFLENQIPGKTITQTYLFDASLKERELPIISIASNDEYFWSDSIGLYTQDFKPTWEYPINIEFFENDGSDRAAFNELAGTRVNGLNSWVLPQKMLGIYFDNDYDKNNLDYQLFFDRKRTRFDNFVLRASGSDWGNTLFRDALSQGLTSENMEIEKMAFRPTIVFINGEYMGIHNMRSRIDESFIEENFGLASTEYDLIENNGKVEEGDNIAFYELFALFDNDLTVDENYQAVADNMDLDNFTDYFIAEIWSSNSSWGHNIQMWKPKAPGSKWRWILQDLDRSFTGIDDELISKFTTSTSPSNYNWARKPLNSLLANEDFSYNFAQRFTDHLFTTFHSRRVSETIEKHKNLIDQEIPYHSERWAGTTSSYGNGIPSVEYWENEVQELFDFANGRPPVLLEDIKNRFNLGELSSLTTINNPTEAGSIQINKLPIPTTPWEGKYFENMPFNLTAEAEVGQEFIGWSTAVYESIIVKGDEWKYLDDGTDQGQNWITADFDDSAWSIGNAKFGYGDNNETTTISFGNDTNDKHITTYFRKAFTIEDINAYSGSILIELLYDDAAAIYINGKEVLRANLPDGPLDYQTLASSIASGDEETTYFNFIIDKRDLVNGTNVIAVEIHQQGANSSDLGFDMEMRALSIQNNTIISTEKTLPVTLNSDTILVANYQSSEICTLPRRISTDLTLDLSCSPYYAVASVTVDSNATLTIEPGVTILFPNKANLEVQGKLMVLGEENNRVHFSAIDENIPWGSVIFHYAQSTSELNYLNITNASNGPHPIYQNAAISAYYSKIAMDHLEIINVESNPILSYYSDVTLDNSTLYSKVTGDLINVKYGQGEVKNSIFRGNNQIDTDAIDFDGVTNGKIINNKISDFLGFNSDGIDIGEETVDVFVEGNFIHNCTDKGISVGQISSLTSSNNTIVNCDIGIAIKDLSTSVIDQNTFYSIGTPISCFEKNVGLGGGSSIVTNSILSNSTKSPIAHDAISSIEISMSLSDTDSLPETMNLFGNPLFTSPGYNEFALQSESIAIGAGLDDDLNIVDLGAQPSAYTAEPSLTITAIQYFPQGEPDAEFIIINNPKINSVNLAGYSLGDAVDFIFPDFELLPGESVLVAKHTPFVSQDVVQEFQWTRGRLANEGETIKLIAPSGIIVDRVRYDNKAPWPLSAEGKGDFLRLIDPALDNHFAESWMSELNTSTENINPPLNIEFYPNPAQNLLFLQSLDQKIVNVEILNTMGQLVKQARPNSYSAHLNTSELNTGTYFVRVNGISLKSPLIILH